jgi:hypothetical protein
MSVFTASAALNTILTGNSRLRKPTAGNYSFPEIKSIEGFNHSTVMIKVRIKEQISSKFGFVQQMHEKTYCPSGKSFRRSGIPNMFLVN